MGQQRGRRRRSGGAGTTLTALLILGAGMPVLLGGPAGAQEPATPVIDRFSETVRYGRAGEIHGRLRGGSMGGEVRLQRRVQTQPWATIDTKSVDGEGRVRWRLLGLRRTASYRLAVTQEASGGVVTSDRVRIYVAPVPVLDRATRATRFRGRVIVAGHLRGGLRGQRVGLQRSLAGRAWRALGTQRAGRNARVRFRLGHPTKTARYRLIFIKESPRVRVASRSARSVVKPKLVVRLHPRNVFEGHRVVVAGKLLPKVAGRRMTIQLRTGGRWKTLARPSVGDRHFRTNLRPARTGRIRLRARFSGDRLNPSAAGARRLAVYRPSPATYYGPGFYGNRTACGQSLHTSTPGVAHKTLPCGTRVAILYGGRTVAVRVIDRGPYGAANWDLTGATARRLGFSGRGYIGVIVGGGSSGGRAAV